MSQLLSKQKRFTLLVTQLILKAYERGYEVTFGEAWRSQETCDLYAAQGKGNKNSLHPLRLAIDLNLFKQGKYLTLTEEYKEMGEYWESLSTQGFYCAWGGRFKDRPDGNHFSLAYANIR